MIHKLLQNLLIESTGGTVTTYYSTAVPMGEDNAVMVELWINALNGSLDQQISAAVEGSNDGTNFDATPLDIAVGFVAPLWVAGSGSGVVPWRWLRVCVQFSGDPDATALVSASIRTYRAS